MSRFNFQATALSGLTVVRRQPLQDERGFLSRLYCSDEFTACGLALPIAQINHTLTRRRGAVRGLHFQHPPHAETKLVNCLRGEVWDVAVDLRRGSPTFLRWYAERLSADNHTSLVIPPGFAHGFQALCDDCELIYLHSTSYHPGSEGALNATDHRLAITWPLAITERSARDMNHPALTADFAGIVP